MDTSPPCRAQGSAALSLDAGLPRSLDVDICGEVGIDVLHPMLAMESTQNQVILGRALMQLCRACLVHFMV